MAELRISDHALVRFLDLAGAGVEAVRLQLEAALDRGHRAASALGASDYLLTIDGCTFVVRNATVTTVLVDLNVHQRVHALDQNKAGGQ
jgi:hypothetical protein